MKLKFLDQYDEKFLMWLRSHMLPPWFHRFFRIYTRIGDGYLWVVILTLLLTLLPEDQWKQVLLTGIGAELISLAIYWIVKLALRRPRPFAVYKNISAEVPPLDTWSFPSGHTMNNVAPALVIAWFFPWLGALAVFVPFSWGMFRIYYGVHFLSDVIAGMLLGALSAYLGLKLLPLTGLL